MPSPTPTKKFRRRLKTLLAVFLLLLVIAVFLIPRMGTYLVRQDKPVKGDALVILMGNIPDRVLEAADLYREGYAGKILIVMADRYGIGVFRKKGIPLDGQTAIAQKALIGLGIPADSIIILPGDAKSTLDEAVAVSHYTEQHPQFDTLLLVTSSYHSRRATLTFNKEFRHLPHPVTIVSCPSKYTGFHSKDWWKDRESAKLVFLEYLKLVNTWLFQ